MKSLLEDTKHQQSTNMHSRRNIRRQYHARSWTEFLYPKKNWTQEWQKVNDGVIYKAFYSIYWLAKGEIANKKSCGVVCPSREA